MTATVATRGSARSPARREGTIRRLDLAVNRKLDGLLQGDHHGLLPGAGTEAGEGRLYAPGDDIRRIDWNLTARSGEVHVRDTIADRELETWLVVDGSASLDFGTADCEKRDLALAAVATFGFLTNRAGNRLGAVVFDGTGTRLLPPRSGREATLALLHRLDQRERRDDPGAAGGDASLAHAIRRTRLMARRRGLIVVVSDFIDPGDWAGELKAAAVRHDVIAAQVTDRRERELPPVGLLTLVDPETGRLLEVQTGDADLRRKFAEAAAAQDAAIRRAVRSAGAGHLTLSTDRDWLVDAVRFVAARRRRR